jgi:type II secretory pathway pseudopilin PulG
MNPALLIPILGVSIPIIAILATTVFRPWLQLKERQMELASSATAEKAAQYAAQTERLEQRVRVLERIVTDRGQDLAGEIERLRDRQDVPTLPPSLNRDQ